MKDLLTPTLTSLTPENIIADPNVYAIAQALDPQLVDVSIDTQQELILSRIDELPEQTLDILAWQMHVDFYDLAYSIDIKRRAVKGSILWHMKKGTVAGILEALHLIDIDATFIHWKDIEGGKPYTFNITAIVAGDFYRTRGKDRLASSIRRAVTEAKAERSYMAKLDIHIQPTESIALFTGTLWVRNWDISLGLEKSIMHELLLMFEKRILDKLISYGERFTEKMNSFSQDLTRKLEENQCTLLARVDAYEANTADRIAHCEAETARRISTCETETARRISECEAQTSARITRCEEETASRIAVCEEETRRSLERCEEATTIRVNGYIARVEAYEAHTAQYFEELVNQIKELHDSLMWLGVEHDYEELELNGYQKGFGE